MLLLLRVLFSFSVAPHAASISCSTSSSLSSLSLSNPLPLPLPFLLLAPRLPPFPPLQDITLAPWVIRHDILHFYRGFQLPSSDPSLSRFLLWCQAVQQLPSVRATLADRDQLRAIYRRYADNTATSQVALAVNAGKALP